MNPVWTYGLQLWGTSSHSNIEIMQRFQSKTLRLITEAPWYVRNENIHCDLGVPMVQQEIQACIGRYNERLRTHPNPLTNDLMTPLQERRLKRRVPTDFLRT